MLNNESHNSALSYTIEVWNRLSLPSLKWLRHLAFSVLSLKLNPSLILILTHLTHLTPLANEPLQTGTMLYGVMYLTYVSVTGHKYLIRCATDYK